YAMVDLIEANVSLPEVITHGREKREFCIGVYEFERGAFTSQVSEAARECGIDPAWSRSRIATPVAVDNLTRGQFAGLRISSTALTLRQRASQRRHKQNSNSDRKSY